eukprot:1595469-Amphidinium_carterae.3
MPTPRQPVQAEENEDPELKRQRLDARLHLGMELDQYFVGKEAYHAYLNEHDAQVGVLREWVSTLRGKLDSCIDAAESEDAWRRMWLAKWKGKAKRAQDIDNLVWYKSAALKLPEGRVRATLAQISDGLDGVLEFLDPQWVALREAAPPCQHKKAWNSLLAVVNLPHRADLPKRRRAGKAKQAAAQHTKQSNTDSHAEASWQGNTARGSNWSGYDHDDGQAARRPYPFAKVSWQEGQGWSADSWDSWGSWTGAEQPAQQQASKGAADERDVARGKPPPPKRVDDDDDDDELGKAQMRPYRNQVHYIVFATSHIYAISTCILREVCKVVGWSM